MLEKQIEQKKRTQLKKVGGLLLKFVSPGNGGVPDRIALRPIPKEHIEIVARYFRFVEFKQPGEALDPLQGYWRDRLTEMGFAVDLEDGRG